jgi:hypothetical protein
MAAARRGKSRSMRGLLLQASRVSFVMNLAPIHSGQKRHTHHQCGRNEGTGSNGGSPRLPPNEWRTPARPDSEVIRRSAIAIVGGAAREEVVPVVRALSPPALDRLSYRCRVRRDATVHGRLIAPMVLASLGGHIPSRAGSEDHFREVTKMVQRMRQGFNLEPPVLETGALPIELRKQGARDP